MKTLENPYLQISQIVSDTFNRLTDDHLEIIFDVKFADKKGVERLELYAYCRDEWEALTWDEIMQILNDIFN